ncbi:MAG: flagellar biosynthesis anti-sigma factor FlgM [Desulfovermiculus sp.]
MTIKIDSDPQITALNKSRKANRTQALEQPEEIQNTDRVQLSASVQQTEDTARAQRVQDLKSQVENGTYNPDMREVAAGLIKFLVQGK